MNQHTTEFTGSRYYLFDGGMGTMLQERGLAPGASPEYMNLNAPEAVKGVHRSYVAAGADIITTNTFGASRHKLGEDPGPFIKAAITLAREAGAPMVAQDIGPLGAMLDPMGTMAYEEAYEEFSLQVKSGEEMGVDLYLIETMSDLLEAKAALLAVKEHSTKPVIVTMTFGEDGRTFLGTEPKTAAITLTALGASAIGINCSLGPKALLPMAEEMLAHTHLPVIVQANAGIPRVVNGETVFDVEPEEFAACGEAFLEKGVTILGGCCGTTPEHIAALSRLLQNRTPSRVTKETDSLFVCGWQKVVELSGSSIHTIGERLNPTGRKRLKDALYSGDMDYVAELAIEQQEEGADLLVVNAGLPDINEREILPKMVLAVQSVSPLPLVIDSSDPIALENALRVYSGRPILNSVNGDPESLQNILPLVKKYGCGIVALALDDSGIAATPEGRETAAMKILEKAEEMGIPKKNFLVDCLAMAASVSQSEVMVTVDAIRLMRSHGLKTVLGVSNISHGLPNRTALNATYLSACFSAGLNVAIINTSIPQMMETVAAARVLMGIDTSAAAYITAYAKTTAAISVASDKSTEAETLSQLIINGKKGEVSDATEALLREKSPLDVVNREIIPALDEVGNRYEKGSIFLPQLMASAEAAKAAFEVISRELPEGSQQKGPVLLATVKGDIHDIGKNIVKMLLENYGYRVIDLGRDVEVNAVLEALSKEKIPLVGLSSLMTTTAQNIAVTIKAIREKGYTCKIMVGGAVVTQTFADQIGADFYAKDAMESARYAASIFGN